MDYNASGQHHADRYSRPKDAFIILRGLDGKWTGHLLGRSQLTYTDEAKAKGAIDGCVRVDLHEYIWVYPESGVHSRMVFHRGGSGYLDGWPPGSAVKYGGVLLSDLIDPLGDPTPSGDGRGSPASDAGLYTIKVTEVPVGMLYKGLLPDGSVPWGSLYATYADLGAEWGGDVRYVPLCWSWLNVGGGGMIRGILHDGQHIRKCKVPPVHMPMWDQTGTIVGEAVGQYVRTSNNVYGWILWAHRLGTDPWTYHVEPA